MIKPSNPTSATAAEPTVFVIDDDPALCESLRWLMESVGLKVQVFTSGKDFLESYNPEQVGCLLVDIRMPGMNGFELQDALIARHNRMPIIVITGHGDIPMAVRALKAGALDFITKPFNAQQLLEQVQKAITQDAHRPEIPEYSSLAERFALLTSREREVMERVVAGKLNKEIAYELGISLKTVELHRSHVMQKIKAKSLAELVKCYLVLNHALG